MVLTSRRADKKYKDIEMALSNPQKRVSRPKISLRRLCCKNSTSYFIFEHYQPPNCSKRCAAVPSSPKAAETSRLSTASKSLSTVPAPSPPRPTSPTSSTLSARNCKRQQASEGCLGAGERAAAHQNQPRNRRGCSAGRGRPPESSPSSSQLQGKLDVEAQGNEARAKARAPCKAKRCHFHIASHLHHHNAICIEAAGEVIDPLKPESLGAIAPEVGAPNAEP